MCLMQPRSAKEGSWEPWPVWPSHSEWLAVSGCTPCTSLTSTRAHPRGMPLTHPTGNPRQLPFGLSGRKGTSTDLRSLCWELHMCFLHPQATDCILSGLKNKDSDGVREKKRNEESKRLDT